MIRRLLNETWKPVAGWPYEVSDHGRLRRVGSSKVCATYTLPNGYVQADFRHDGKKVHRYVHRLVAEAFHGIQPSCSHEVAHQNGVRSDNRANNLRWASRSENHLDKRDHGTMLRGSKHHMAKLTEPQVIEIRRRVNAGEKQKDLAVEFRMSKMAISRAVRGENWRHVE